MIAKIPEGDLSNGEELRKYRFIIPPGFEHYSGREGFLYGFKTIKGKELLLVKSL